MVGLGVPGNRCDRCRVGCQILRVQGGCLMQPGPYYLGLCDLGGCSEVQSGIWRSPGILGSVHGV